MGAAQRALVAAALAAVVVVGQHPGRPGAGRLQQLLDVADAGAEHHRVPGRVQRGEVERHVQFVAGAVVLQDAFGRADVHLAHQHAVAGVAVDDPADAAQHLVAVGLVVEVGQRLAGQAARIVGEARILAGAVDDVDAKTVDAALEPEAQHAMHRLDDLRVAPVQVRLLRQEQVQVVLLGVLVPGPGAAGVELRAPVVRLVAPDVPVAPGVVSRAARLEEPGVLVRRMVGYEVQQHTDATGMGLGDQPVDIGQRAEQRVDVAVVADVVAGIDHRRAEHRRQPQRIDAQPLQMVELAQHAREVADAVAVAVGERAWVDLVDGGAFPPRRLGWFAHARFLLGPGGSWAIPLCSYD
ncbi:hypothetical protein BAY1663_04539 [Pseudomonas sp. BAY1663]|nr:hypothetical protein BAY1663_04539 [Pseudomonas sp. BAY1663]